VAGHELIHRREWYNKIIGILPYTKCGYTHFLDEHIAGHHKFVATNEDPDTARLNESVYYFYLRTFYQSHAATWNRELKRIKKEHG